MWVLLRSESGREWNEREGILRHSIKRQRPRQLMSQWPNQISWNCQSFLFCWVCVSTTHNHTPLYEESSKWYKKDMKRVSYFYHISDNMFTHTSMLVPTVGHRELVVLLLLYSTTRLVSVYNPSPLERPSSTTYGWEAHMDAGSYFWYSASPNSSVHILVILC